MRLNRFLFVCCLGYSLLAFAQLSQTEENCRRDLLVAEKQRNSQIYTRCGFDNLDMALIQWKGWAERNHAYQAMYELCVRYPDTADGERLCQLAAIGGNGPALLIQGDKLYDQKKYQEAFQSYTSALKSSVLTADEKGRIAEKIAVIYLDPQSSYYNPAKGLPLIEKATGQRGALANNIMGVYSMFGLEKQPADMKKAFEYFWRSVLLGCSNAEENLGLFYLVHQQKITLADARQLMKDKIFSCRSGVSYIQSEQNLIQRDCNCAQVQRREQLARQYSYRLLSIMPTGAVLQDGSGQRFSVMQDTVLPDGSKVSEIRKTAVILLKGKQRQVLVLEADEACIQYCKVKQEVKERDEHALPNVEPYHLTFTPSECADLLYYAERLVDTKLPFTGKKECGFSGELDEATKLLMTQ